MSVTLTVIDPQGRPHEISAPEGVSLMEAIRNAALDGIPAECNGNAACATCHVYCEPPAGIRLPPAAEVEADMLEFTASPSRETSRLSCQVRLASPLSGMVVTIPATQY